MGNEVKGRVGSPAYWRVRAGEVSAVLKDLKEGTTIEEVLKRLGSPFYRDVVGDKDVLFYLSFYPSIATRVPVSLNNTTPLIFKNGALLSKDNASFWSLVWGRKVPSVGNASMYVAKAFPKVTAINDSPYMKILERYITVTLPPGDHTLTISSPHNPVAYFNLPLNERLASTAKNNFIQDPNGNRIVANYHKDFDYSGWIQLNKDGSMKLEVALEDGMYQWHWIARKAKDDTRRGSYCNTGDIYYRLFKDRTDGVELKKLD